MLLSFAGLAVLGRLLTPADFGLFGIILSIEMFLRPIVDLGLSPAYVQQPALEPYTEDVFFAANVGMGLVNAVVLAALAPLLVMFYERDILLPLTLLYALSVVAASFGRQANASLLRRRRFVGILVAGIVGRAGGLGVGIAVAFLGLSIWALVIQAVTVGVVTSVLFLALAGCRYRLPTWSQVKGTLSGLRFGLLVMVAQIVGSLTRSLDNLAVGKIYGESVLGQYGRGAQVSLMPEILLRNPLGVVAMSYLCRLEPGRSARASAYRSFANVMLLGPGALCLCLLFMGDYLILFVMGPQWVAAGQYARVFGLLGFGAVVQGTLATLHFAEARLRVWVILNVVGFAVIFGPPLVAGLLGADPQAFVVIISVLTILYWLATLAVASFYLLDAKGRRILAWTLLLLVGTLLPAGWAARQLLGAIVPAAWLPVKVLVVAAAALAAALAGQFLMNRTEFNMMCRHMWRRGEGV